MDCKERSLLARRAIVREGLSRGDLTDRAWLWLRDNRGYLGKRASVLSSISGLMAGKTCHAQMLDAIEHCLKTTPMKRPHSGGKRKATSVSPSSRLIRTGERQTCATVLRGLVCIALGESLERTHKIHFSSGVREVFGTFAPLKEGEAYWDDLDEWIRGHITVKRIGDRVELTVRRSA